MDEHRTTHNLPFVDRLMKPQEAWERMQISRTMFYRMVRRGELPVRRIGRAIRISERSLVQFMAGDAA